LALEKAGGTTVRKHRRGYSLVECLVAISLFGFIFGTIALTLHSVRRGDFGVRDEIQQERSVDRLALLLREDVHRATSASLEADQQRPKSETSLRLVLPAKRFVDYKLEADDVVRTLRDGDQIVLRDRFPIRSLSLASWKIDSSVARPLVTLWLPLAHRLSKQPSLYRFTAVVGLDNDEVLE
jgi:prepilin-type N-terminal cleavage/methylation domain-containing protein